MTLAARVSHDSDEERTVEFYDIDSDFGVAAIQFNRQRWTDDQIAASTAQRLDELTEEWTAFLAVD